MTQAVYAGSMVELDAEGFMTRADAWSRPVGEAISQELNISLTPEHWRLIDFAREDFSIKNTSPGLRRISKYTKTGMKDIYRLFPKGPGKLIARIAGLPKPKSCL
ncbi:MAG: TusE/DsrC/DsvC family sulfur relay protein [Acidobacteriota bacterium]|nr:TusE/DsrC/DsvC family sulfur relay protein [Acidobacteriota bacterium]